MVGGSPFIVRNMDEFNMALFNSGLLSMDFEGVPYTSTNGIVWQQLDRVLINQDCSVYAISKVSHLAGDS